MNFDLIILGAGAAGLYGALRASQQGLSVLVLDLAKEVGQKFRLAGGGHANITNLQMDSQYYVSQNPSFCTQVLKKFPPRLSLDLLAEFNIPWEERDHGRIFCTVPVSKLIQAMKETCVAKKVVFGLGFPIGEVNYAQKLFHVQHNRQVYTAPNLMAALGSPAWPACGASDYGIHLAKSFGHKIWPFKPVLCPLILDANSPLQGLAGISLEVEASVGERKFTDALLFTHKGLSGPAILQASCFWQRQDSVYGTIY